MAGQTGQGARSGERAERSCLAIRRSGHAQTLAVLFVVVFAAGCGESGQMMRPYGDTADAAIDPARRGEYLVETAGCHTCHTPLKEGPTGPQSDRTRMLSGHQARTPLTPPPILEAPWQWVATSTNTAFAGPWGISYAANLTPDRKTGLGLWTEDDFVRTLRTGQHMGVSRPLAPPMPWRAYARFSDQDLRAIFAYLGTIPSIVNHVPDYVPPLQRSR